MNIDDLTWGEIKRIGSLLDSGQQSEVRTKSPSVGKKCIVRTYASGVHFGEVVSVTDRTVELKNARRLWYWKAKSGISLSAVAMNGIGSGSKVADLTPQITLLDGLELIPVSDEALPSIEGASVQSAS